ncbi:MAG: VIT domain-containing protein [Verrucomicrobia bacterium]|nr:VIT domain-containing protein [Verrucomicrobiota bacterium]
MTLPPLSSLGRSAPVPGTGALRGFSQDATGRTRFLPWALAGVAVFVVLVAIPQYFKQLAPSQARDAAFVREELNHDRASISGYIGAVEVTQQFLNPYSSKIEAVYVFSLPHNAAINEIILVIGERRIRGIIRERQEAEQIYKEDKRQGYVASLLTEERPNVFTQSVANIEPGKQIDVNIKYFHTLEYADGWYEFVFPMVVGPRFNPPGMTDGIGTVARGATGLSGQRVDTKRRTAGIIRIGGRPRRVIDITARGLVGMAQWSEMASHLNL